MAVHSAWTIVDTDYKNKISFIEDICHLTGQMSITNDAENVLQHFHEWFDKTWRVVYKDTENEWWEIVTVHSRTCSYVRFDKWNGLAWDILKR